MVGFTPSVPDVVLATVSLTALFPIQDIIGGLLISFVLLSVVVPVINVIDNFILYSSYPPLVALITIIVLLYIYPVDPDRYTVLED